MNIATILIILAGIAICVVWHKRLAREAKQIVIDWVTSRGMAVGSIRPPILDYGPFTSSVFDLGDHFVFRVEARTESGIQVLWFRVGAGFWGMWKPKIEVEAEPSRIPVTD